MEEDEVDGSPRSSTVSENISVGESVPSIGSEDKKENEATEERTIPASNIDCTAAPAPEEEGSRPYTPFSEGYSDSFVASVDESEVESEIDETAETAKSSTVSPTSSGASPGDGVGSANDRDTVTADIQEATQTSQTQEEDGTKVATSDMNPPLQSCSENPTDVVTPPVAIQPAGPPATSSADVSEPCPPHLVSEAPSLCEETSEPGPNPLQPEEHIHSETLPPNREPCTQQPTMDAPCADSNVGSPEEIAVVSQDSEARQNPVPAREDTETSSQEAVTESQVAPLSSSVAMPSSEDAPPECHEPMVTVASPDAGVSEEQRPSMPVVEMNEQSPKCNANASLAPPVSPSVRDVDTLRQNTRDLFLDACMSGQLDKQLALTPSFRKALSQSPTKVVTPDAACKVDPPVDEYHLAPGAETEKSAAWLRSELCVKLVDALKDQRLASLIENVGEFTSGDAKMEANSATEPETLDAAQDSPHAAEVETSLSVGGERTPRTGVEGRDEPSPECTGSNLEGRRKSGTTAGSMLGMQAAPSKRKNFGALSSAPSDSSSTDSSGSDDDTLMRRVPRSKASPKKYSWERRRLGDGVESERAESISNPSPSAASIKSTIALVTSKLGDNNRKAKPEKREECFTPPEIPSTSSRSRPERATPTRVEPRGLKEAFLETMRKKGEGSVMVAVRRYFQLGSDGKLAFQSFCKGLARIEYHEDALDLWHAFNTDGKGHLGLEVFGYDDADIIEAFRKWCKRKAGGPLALFAAADEHNYGSLSKADLMSGLRRLGLFTTEKMPEEFRSEDFFNQRMYPMLDPWNKGNVDAKSFALLQRDDEGSSRTPTKRSHHRSPSLEEGSPMVNEMRRTPSKVPPAPAQAAPLPPKAPTSALKMLSHLSKQSYQQIDVDKYLQPVPAELAAMSRLQKEKNKAKRQHRPQQSRSTPELATDAETHPQEATKSLSLPKLPRGGPGNRSAACSSRAADARSECSMAVSAIATNRHKARGLYQAKNADKLPAIPRSWNAGPVKRQQVDVGAYPKRCEDMMSLNHERSLFEKYY